MADRTAFLQSAETAADYHDAGVTSLLALEKLHYIKHTDEPDSHCGECAVHMLIGQSTEMGPELCV